MHILRNFLVAFSIAAVAAPVYLRAEDTDAQAAARAALRQKMQELNGGQPAAATQETAPATNAVAPTPSPDQAPAATPSSRPMRPRPVLPSAPNRSTLGQPVPPPVATPAPEPMGSAPVAVEKPAPPSALTVTEPTEPANNDLIEQARAATRARILELEKQKKSAATPESQPAYQTPTQTPAQPATTETKPSKEEIRAEKERKAAEKRAAEEKAAQERATAKKMAEEKAAAEKAAEKEARQKKTAQSKPAEKKSKTQETKAKAMKEAPPVLAPLPAPPPAVPASKEEKLNALLQQYESDKITAEEYHDQRAKILAEP